MLLRKLNANRTTLELVKKIGLYGCGFLIPGDDFNFCHIGLTKYHTPFQGTERVGP